MIAPDARLRLSVDQLAADALEGLFPARRYVAPHRRRGGAGVAGVHREASAVSERLTELLFGETFDVIAEADGWAFGQCGRDGYVGYAPTRDLTDPGPAPTHRVRAGATIALDRPSVRAPVRLTLPMNSLATAVEVDGAFARVEGAGWVPTAHLAPITAFETRPLDVALTFAGSPYLWGGRTRWGIDCSGLVQTAFHACGLSCPRDSDLQMAIGRPVAPSADLDDLQPGDLVFWKGHVGLMADGARLLHANAYAMAVTFEPITEAVDRINRAGGGPPTGFRRP